MKRAFFLALTLVACGGAKPVPGGGGPSEQTPQWLRQGTGAFNVEGGKRFQGVGVVTGMRDPKTRRQASDAKAKEQLAQNMDAFAQTLTKMSESTKENLGDEIAGIVKRVAAQAQIRDHWVTSEGAESALDVLDLAAFKQTVQSVEGDDKVKRELANNADRAFDQLSK